MNKMNEYVSEFISDPWISIWIIFIDMYAQLVRDLPIVRVEYHYIVINEAIFTDARLIQNKSHFGGNRTNLWLIQIHFAIASLSFDLKRKYKIPMLKIVMMMNIQIKNQ